ncbi:MAG: WecB/TagA/CpsF family glycosyltransferase, partial [Candidatus Parcubacteria bacterium]|nr:WecB/TagA/CpsF family glycosyltransferase [Candidatus Parcubacteria bacterium]
MINNDLKMSAKGGSADPSFEALTKEVALSVGGKEIYILGSKINDVSLAEVISEIQKLFSESKKGYIVTPNPEICLVGYKDKQFRRIIQNSFISIPDGFGLKLGARFFGSKLNNLTTGIDLCWELLKLAEHKNYSILFFEGRPQIGDRALKVISQKYPNLKIKFIDPGKVEMKGNFENPNLINQINEFHPDIIFVNFGPPKQENFINKYLDQLDTKLMLGIGGSLDFISGRIKRAPESWRKLGLEWFWRLIQEPWRWKRILKAVIIFPLACLYWRFGTKFFYRKNVAGFVINDQKQIFLAKHSIYQEWKLPQGGAKNAKTDEDYKNSIMREMNDELGTDKFQIIEMIKNCYKYKFPLDKIDKY